MLSADAQVRSTDNPYCPGGFGPLSALLWRPLPGANLVLQKPDAIRPTPNPPALPPARDAKPISGPSLDASDSTPPLSTLGGAPVHRKVRFSASSKLTRSVTH
jgi:hypothetical protein